MSLMLYFLLIHFKIKTYILIFSICAPPNITLSITKCKHYTLQEFLNLSNVS